MISFTKYITEFKAEPYDYDWEEFTFNSGEAKFTTVNDKLITYNIEHDKNVVIRTVDNIEHHEISFEVSLGYRGTTRKIDTGNPFRVFMTVKSLTDEYIKKFGDKIKMIIFSAAKTDEEDLGRSKLYTRFAKDWKRLYPKQEWQAYTMDKGVEGTFFYIVNQALIESTEQEIIDNSKLTKL